MAKRKIKGVLLDIENNEAKIVDFEPSLENYYRMLHCTCIDITERRIGVHCKKYFDIICDDEGLLKQDPKISAINDLGEPMLVGSLLIVGNEVGGVEQSLSEEDAEYVLGMIHNVRTRLYPKGYKVLTQCEV